MIRPVLVGTVATLVAGLAIPVVRAASQTWSGTTDSVWATVTNWISGVAPGTGDTAIFSGTGNAHTTVDLGTGVTIQNVIYDTPSAAAYTIGTGAVGSQTLTLNDGGAITVNPTVANNQLFNSAITLGADASANTYTFTNNSASTLTFAGNISGGAGGTGGTKTLTFGGSGNIFFSGNFNRDTATANSNLGITKTGTGILTINPTGNVGSASGPVTIRGGRLAIDFTNAGANANLLSGFSSLNMNGGRLQIIGNATNASSQTFGNTAIQSGFNVISVGTNNPTLNLAGYSQTLGTALRFDGLAYNSNATGATTVTVAALGTITTTTSSAVTSVNTTAANAYTNPKGLMFGNNALRSGVPTVGLYDWASTNLADGTPGAANSTYSIQGGSQVTGFYTTVADGGTAANQDFNYDIAGATAKSGTGTAFVQTLRFNANLATTFNNAGTIMLLNGILVTPNVGAFNETFTGAKLAAGSLNNAPGAITIWQNNTAGELIINTDIGQRGAGATTYVQAGDGTVVLGNASNSYTGQTNLLRGNTVVTNYANFGPVGTNANVNLIGGTVVGNGGSFSMTSGATKRNFVLGNRGGGLAATGSNVMTIDGVVSGAAGTGGLVIGIPASTANGNVAGLLPGTGSIANGQAIDTANTTAVFGTGTVALTGVNTYTGGTTIVGGATLNFNALSALGGTNYGGITFNGGTLQYAASNTTDVSVNTGTGATYPGMTGITLASGGGTIDTNGNNVIFANPIGNNGTGGFTKKGTGTLTLSGANAYSGATAVNAGSLVLSASASLGNTAISVASGAALLAKPGTGNTQIGSTAGSLNLNAGATFSMVDAAIGTTTINLVGTGAGTVLTLGGTTTTPTTLSFELGSTGADQLIANNGVLSFAGAAQENITLTALGATAPATLTGIPLLSVPNGNLSGLLANFSLQTLAVSFGANNYIATLGLGAGNTQLQLNLAQVVSTPFYWTGATSNSWATASNFANSHTGLTAQGGVPLAANNVFETADNAAANFTQTVGTTTINSLNFTGTGTPAATNSVTLGNGTLTLSAGVGFNDDVNSASYAPGTGLVVQSGSAAHNISANVVLGTSQTWEIDNDTAKPLTVSGNVTGSGKTLTKTGSGKLILSGAANNYAATVISAGTVAAGVVNALPTASTLTVQGTGTFDLAGNSQNVTGLADGGVSTGTITSSSGTPTLTVNNSTPNTFSGTISGPLTLAATGTSSLTLSGANTYSGPTNISGGGSVKISAANNLGDGSATNTVSLNASTLDSTGGTYALGPNRAVALTGTGTVQVDAGVLTVDGIVSGVGGALTKTGVGTLALGNTNTYDGLTSINGGVLQISAANNLGNGSATNTVSINGGTLELTANSVDLGVNRAIALPGAATFQADAGTTLTVSGAITGAGTLTNTGAGILSLTGADTATGATVVNAGTLTVGAAGSIIGTPTLTLANGATLNIAGGTVTLPNTATAYTANVNSKVYVSGGSFTFSNVTGINNNTQFRGLFTQTGGTVNSAMGNLAPNATETFTLYVGGNGSFVSNDGQFASFTVGTRGVASAYVSGTGNLTVNSTAAHPMVVGSTNNTGGNDVGGGAGSTAGQRTFVQQGGTVTTNFLTLGAVQVSAGQANPGVYYLRGGSLTTGSLNRGATGGTSGGTLNFGGGTFKSGAAFSTDANVATNINSGGAKIDTNGGDLTWSGVIAAGTTGNVIGFTGLNGGSGYTAAPTVTFDNTGTGGAGVTGTAVINAAGQVIDVVITNPGAGYASAPTFTFSAPAAGTTASVVAGTIATGNGGLTKTGNNILTLPAANTYLGATTISAGTVSTGAAGLLTNGGTSGSLGRSSNAAASLVLDGGTLQYANTGAAQSTDRLFTLTQNSGALDASGTNAVTFAGNGAGTANAVVFSGSGARTLTLTGSSTAANTFAPILGDGIGGATALAKTGAGTWTLGNANTYSGGTTVSAGILNVANASGSATGSGNVSVATGGTLGGSGAISGSVTVDGGTVQPGAAGFTLTLGGLTYNSGTLSFSLDGSAVTSSKIATTSATFMSTPTLTFNIANPAAVANGQVYTLLTSTNDIAGGGNLTGLPTKTLGRITLTPSESGTHSIVVTAVGTAANLTWAGGVTGLGGSITGDGTTWDNTQTATVSGNWNHSGNYDSFYDFDSVTFNDTGAPSHIVNLGTDNNVGSVTVNTASSYTFNGPGTMKGSGNLTLAGGALILNTANTYTGGTNINAGTTLTVGVAGAVPSTGTVSVAGTLDLGGFNQTIGSLSDGGVSTGLITNGGGSAVTLTAGSTANTTYSGAIHDGATGTVALTKVGTGALTLSGSESYTGATSVNAGTLTVGATGSINGTSSLTVANGATLNIAGGSVTLPATGNTTGGAYTGFTAGGNNTAVYVSGGSLSYGNYIQADPNAALRGTFTQTGGTVTTAESNMAPGTADTFQFYLGGTGTGANAATYTSTQGYYGNFTVGTRGLANAYVSGTGQLTVIGPSISGGIAGIIVGAQFATATAGVRTFVQQGGTVTTTGLRLGSLTAANTGSGVYYLNGGTLTTNTLTRGTLAATTGTLNFGGGTFKTGVAFSTDATVVTNINSGGATIDTTGGDLTWSGALAVGTVGNVSGFTGLSGGSGYTTTPTVAITGGGGTGATAVAILNANGAVTDVVITNPGSGYTSTPTFTFSAPASGTTASVAGTTIATGSGGLTKTGANTLTLAGANNSYSGTTTVNAGTLKISGSLSGTTALISNTGGSVVLASAERVANTATLTLGGGSLGFATPLSGATETLTSLTVSAAGSVLDFGSGNQNNKFTFNSPANGLSLGGFQLAIYNWTGSLYSPAATIDDGSDTTQDRLLFAGTTLPANALQNVRFYSDAGTTFLGYGHEVTYTGGGFEVVPVPEPSSAALLGAAALLGLAGFRGPRRSARSAVAGRG